MSLLWLLLSFLALAALERWIHRHLQGIWLLVFRHPDMALIVYSLIMLPGVIVHEASHWLAATLLGVRAGRVSVMPQRLPDGTLRLGYVETERTDMLREALIGIAPLLVGLAAILLVGYSRLGVGPAGEAVARGDLPGMARSVWAMQGQPDFWLWVYLIFTIANSMLPSASDRRAWLPLAASMSTVLALVVFAGFGPALVESLSRPFEAATRAVAAGFTLTVGLNLGILPFIWLVEQTLIRLTGLKVEY